MLNQDEYKVVADRLCSLSNQYGTAGFWRRLYLSGKIAELVWTRMPLIYSALIHHVAGMKAQRS